MGEPADLAVHVVLDGVSGPLQFTDAFSYNDEQQCDRFSIQLRALSRSVSAPPARLGRAISHGDERELVYWIIPGNLACAHRPLRYHALYGGSRRPLPFDAAPLIAEWVELIKIEGIKSIISLWHDGDTACYRSLPLGNGDLLAYFALQGFTIAHHPYEDPAHKRTPPAQARATLERVRTAALNSYDELPKPVLLMCSAGQDRSAPIGAYISVHRATESSGITTRQQRRETTA